MKILVALKRVLDVEETVRIRADGSDVDPAGFKWILNPFDEIAIEEAVRLREAGLASEVDLVCIGPQEAEAHLQHALAMGADSAQLVRFDGEIDSDLAARVLVQIYKERDYDLVLMGKQAADTDNAQTGPRMAAYLEIEQICFASKLQVENEGLLVTRITDNGTETVRVPTPCVVTVDLRMNEPRYVALAERLKAKKSPPVVTPIEDLGLDTKPKVQNFNAMLIGSTQRNCKTLKSVEELISLLSTEQMGLL